MRPVRLTLAVAVCCSLVFLAAPLSFGQAVYGNIVGSVADPSGAAVPNATVTVTNVAQGGQFHDKDQCVGQLPAGTPYRGNILG